MAAKTKIIGTLISSFVLTIALAFSLPRPENRSIMRQWFWLNKTYRLSDAELIIAGDSRAYRGIDPKSFGDDLNSINLAYSAAGFSKEYLDFVCAHFHENGKEKVLILGLTPFSFTPTALKNEHLESFLIMSAFQRNKGLYINPTLQLFEPRTVEDLYPINTSENYTEVYHKNGWMESNDLPGDSLSALKSYQSIFDENRVQESAVSYLMIRVDSLRKAGVTIIGLRPPTTPQMRALEDSISGYNEQALKHQFEAAGGLWIDVKDEYFATYDGSHLRPADARRLSKTIRDKIKQL
jgi:hypothetical protein